MAAEWRQRGPSCLWVFGHLVDGSVLIGMGNSWEEQVFEGMMGQTWVGGGWVQLAWEEVWKKSLLRSPPLSTSPRTRHAQGPHPQASQTPDGLEGENMGFLEGAGPSGAAPLSP